MNKSLSVAFLTIIIGLMLITSLSLNVIHASTGVIGIITSNQTWTKANSPYTLTGPTDIDRGVTVTIEAGATVDLNSYYIRVDGTLIAKGTSTDRINISDGSITFTVVANGWNETNGTGSVFEYTDLTNTPLISSVALKMKSSSITASGSITGNSVIVDSAINDISVNGNAAISNNNISKLNILVGTPVITNNTITVISGSGSTSAVITNNTIGSIGGVNNTASSIFYFGGNSPIIANNTIKGGILFGGTSPTISNNLIIGYIYGPDLKLGDAYGGGIYIGALIPSNAIISLLGGGSASISNNTLIGRTYNYTHESFIGGLRGTTSDLLETSGISLGSSYQHVYIGSNTISNCSTGINYGASGQGTIENNYLGGIVVTASANLTIQRNIIDNGITDNGRANLMILNNSINSAGIQVSGSAIINFNNILNYGLYSLYLLNTPSNINATYNWWGTTNQTTIRESFYDYHRDFNLGNVTFIPFFGASNPQAMPNPTATNPPPVIPEQFPSALIFTLLAIATFTRMVTLRKKIKHQNLDKNKPLP